MRFGAGLLVLFVLYVPVSVLGFLTVVASQGLTGRENIYLGYAWAWFLLYGVTGVIVLAVGGLRDKDLGASVLAFGFGGSLAGLLEALMLRTELLGRSASIFIAFALPFTLPWILAVSACVGLHKRKHDHQQETVAHR